MKMNILFLSKKVIFMIVFSLLLVVLASCSSDANKSSDGKSSEGKWAGQEIKVLIVGDDKMKSSTDPKSGETVPGLNKVKKKFEEEHPGAKVKFVVTPWKGYTEKTQAMITSGGADVYQLPGIADYGQQGVLEPLKPYIERDEFDLDQYIEGAVDTWKVFDSEKEKLRIYGLPKNGGTRVTAYDKKLFDQWGVEYLSENPTMEEIKKKAKKMTGENPETGKKNYGVWFRGERDLAFTLTNIAEGLGGKWGTGKEIDEAKFSFDSPEMKKGAEWLKDMSQYAPTGITNSQGDEKWLSKDNNIAIKLQVANADVVEGALASDITDRIGISDDFSNDEGIGGFAGGSPMAIAKDSKQKDLAWEFIKFVSSDFFQKYNWDANKALPATKSAADLKAVQKNHIATDSMKAMKNPWTPRYPWASSEPRYILSSNVESILTDKKSVDEALKQAQKESTEWVDRR